jgi:hypothetical protein
MQQDMGGAQTGDNGGANGTPDANNTDKVVKWDGHKRAVDDMMSYKKQVGDLKGKLDSLEGELSNIKQRELEGQGNYKTLWEKERERAEAAEAKAKNLANNVAWDKKFTAVHSALLKSGLRSDASELIELQKLDDVALEYTSEGRFFVNGVETFVENFKKKYPYAFQITQTPQVNGGGGSATHNMNGGSDTVTPAMVVAAELESKKDPQNKDKREKFLFLYKRYNEQKTKK